MHRLFFLVAGSALLLESALSQEPPSNTPFCAPFQAPRAGEKGESYCTCNDGGRYTMHCDSNCPWTTNPPAEFAVPTEGPVPAPGDCIATDSTGGILIPIATPTDGGVLPPPSGDSPIPPPEGESPSPPADVEDPTPDEGEPPSPPEGEQPSPPPEGEEPPPSDGEEDDGDDDDSGGILPLPIPIPGSPDLPDPNLPDLPDLPDPGSPDPSNPDTPEPDTPEPDAPEPDTPVILPPPGAPAPTVPPNQPEEPEEEECEESAVPTCTVTEIVTSSAGAQSAETTTTSVCTTITTCGPGGTTFVTTSTGEACGLLEPFTPIADTEPPLTDLIVDDSGNFMIAGATQTPTNDSPPSSDPTPPPQPDSRPADQAEVRCAGTDNIRWGGLEAYERSIDEFCAGELAPNPNEASTSREFGVDGPDWVQISIDWSDLNWRPSQDDCKAYLRRLTAECDASPENPMNWKHGGTVDAGVARLNIYPLRDRYKHGMCEAHVTESIFPDGNVVLAVRAYDPGRKTELFVPQDAGSVPPFAMNDIYYAPLSFELAGTTADLKIRIGDQEWVAGNVEGTSQDSGTRSCRVGDADVPGLFESWNPNRMMDCRFDC